MFAKKLNKTAYGLIFKYGNYGTLTKITLGEYNPDIGRREETPTNYNVKYFKENFSSFDIAQGLAGVDDFKATVAFEEAIDKTWLLDGAEIINVLKTEVQDTLVIQELQCRK